ncbi:MAG: hypothetical protein ACLPOA_06770 [Methylocella sp.]
MDTQNYLRPKAAAEFLKSEFGHGSERTLAKLRSIGGGPPFHKIGVKLIVYTEPELAGWAKSKVSPPLASTSDRGGA